MCREIKTKRNFKYHKKGFMSTELMLDGLLEMAPALRNSQEFDWENKEMVYFSREEKMKIINFIQRNERRFTDGDKLEPLAHLESKQPKTIHFNTQIYKDKHQLRIFIQVPKESGRKNLNMSLDWYQVVGFKLWLEESLRKDVRGRMEDTLEAYAVLKGDGADEDKVVRRIPRQLQKGDLYKWDELLTVECTGRMYDSAGGIWTYYFEVQRKEQKKNASNQGGSTPGVEEEGVKSLTTPRRYLETLNKKHSNLIRKCLRHYNVTAIKYLKANEVNNIIRRVERERLS